MRNESYGGILIGIMTFDAISTRLSALIKRNRYEK